MKIMAFLLAILVLFGALPAMAQEVEIVTVPGISQTITVPPGETTTGAVTATQIDTDYEALAGEPKLKLTLADVVDVLAEYRVVFDPSPIFCMQYWGLTQYLERTITICANMDTSQRRATMIHELLHVVSMRRSVVEGEQYTEMEIQEAVQRIYKELYGRGFK